MDQCPICQKPYGKRKRCYYCNGKPRQPREERTCLTCGTSFFLADFQLKNNGKGGGSFCSRDCKWKALKEKTPPWAKPEEKTRHSAGYVLIWNPEHPRAHNGRVFEHIVVMEGLLGRSLLPGEFVHHKDEDKANNHPDNLVVLTNAEHAALHSKDNPLFQQRRVTIQCHECGKDFEVPPYKTKSDDPRTKQLYCSLPCRHASWARQMVEKRRQKRQSL